MPNVTVSTSLTRIQCDPNSGPNPVATAFFSKTTTIDDQTFEAPWTPVTWPLQSDKMVTVDGVDYPYYLASQIITAIAYQELAALSAPAPTPEE